jgi:proteasome lid subunit RPN8/RPN11
MLIEFLSLPVPNYSLSIVNEGLNMIDFQASPKKYSRDRTLYGGPTVNLIPEANFPTIYGKFKQRIFEFDYDTTLKSERSYNPPRAEKVDEHLWLPFEGSKISQDPANLLEKGHRLHPIEVVIDRSVMEEIVALGRKVCPDATSEDVLEVMGFLAGKIKMDEHGRLWSHVTRSFHLPVLVGRPDHVVLPAEQSGKWLTEIREAGLIYLGLWHTHPTYHPFQSDARLWNFVDSMDVQTLKKKCHAWYHCSLVVDPYAGPENVASGNLAESGCYKAVNPGIPISKNDKSSGLEMGWRSVAHMIKGDSYV